MKIFKRALVALFFCTSAYSQTAMIGLQPFATWIPLKKTISYTQKFTPKWSAQAEYAFSSYDIPFSANLGEISEKKTSLVAKFFPRVSSLYFDFGAVFSDTRAQLGKEILGYSASVETKTLGALVGIGNRWQFENGFTLGIDWARMNAPIFVTETDMDALSRMTNDSDRADIKGVINKLNRIPTFVFLGFNLGYTF